MWARGIYVQLLNVHDAGERGRMHAAQPCVALQTSAN